MNGGMISRGLFSRRGFLTVGAAGFGLTLGDYFALKARADQTGFEPLTPRRARRFAEDQVPTGCAAISSAW